MNRLILATVAAMVLGAPLALADNTHTGVMPTNQAKTQMSSNVPGRCATLDAQFDRANATHKADKYYKEALALHTEGKTLCSSREPMAGAKYLASALRIIDAQPKI